MTNYGPNKEEKWELGYILFCISSGSIAAALSFMLPAPGIIVLIPGGGIVLSATVLAFNWAQRLSFRIRIEESREKSELIDKIVAIYRGNG